MKELTLQFHNLLDCEINRNLFTLTCEQIEADIELAVQGYKATVVE